MDNEKIRQLEADFEQHGLDPELAVPRLFRFFCAIGLKLAPPVFLTSFSIVALFGISYAILSGVGIQFIWLVLALSDVMPNRFIVWIASAAGLILGISMAVYYRRAKIRLSLSTWKDYTAT